MGLTSSQAFFDDIFGDFTPESKSYPKHNLYKRGDEYYLQLAVAGYSPSDIGITVDNHYLYVESTKISEEGREYLDKGISFKSFKRSFKLSKNVDESKIDASQENGILTIHLPIKEEAQPKSRVIGIDVA